MIQKIIRVINEYCAVNFQLVKAYPEKMFCPDSRPVIIPERKGCLCLQIFSRILDTVTVYENLLVIRCYHIQLFISGNQESAAKSVNEVFPGVRTVIGHFNLL